MRFQRIAVILPGPRRSLPRFVYCIVLTMPYVTGELAVPLWTHLTGHERIAKPTLYELVLILKFYGALASIRSISWHSGRTRVVFVVWAPDIAAGISSSLQAFVVRRPLDSARLPIVSRMACFLHPSLRYLILNSVMRSLQRIRFPLYCTTYAAPQPPKASNAPVIPELTK